MCSIVIEEWVVRTRETMGPFDVQCIDVLCMFTQNSTGYYLPEVCGAHLEKIRIEVYMRSSPPVSWFELVFVGRLL